MLPSWKIMEDVLGGEIKVKAADDEYLPMLAEQDTLEYQRYKTRASFFEATSRTRDALIGFIYRKDPQVKAPGIGNDDDSSPLNPALKAFIADATLTGKSLYDVGKEVCSKVTGFGRYLSIIDWDEEEGQPYVVNYAAEDIINWNHVRRRGKMVLSQLVLHELSPDYIDIGDADKPADIYIRKFYDQWRVWKLNDDGQGGEWASCEVYRKRKNAKGATFENRPDLAGTGAAPGAKVASRTEDFVKVAEYIPIRKGKTLSDIPAVAHTTEGPFVEHVSHPPLLGMALINLSLYRTSADYENALHITGCPTAWFAGFAGKNGEIHLGSTEALVTDEPTAKCGFLALKDDLKAFETAEDRKERRMAALGARMLDAQHSLGRSPEAYATVALRQTGETAVLVGISLSLTQSMTDILAWALWWCSTLDTPEDAEEFCSYTLNTDFLGTMLDPATATALVATWLQFGMSFDSLFTKLQQSEWLPPDRTIEEEKELIEEGKSVMTPLMDAAGGQQKTPPAGGSTVVAPERAGEGSDDSAAI